MPPSPGAPRTAPDTQSPPPTVGQLIGAARRERGLTLQQLADQAGCGRSYLSLIENGRRAAPADDMLERIEVALNMARGVLIRAARWHAAPPDVRRQLSRLHSREEAARRLAAMLTPVSGAGSGSGPEAATSPAADRASQEQAAGLPRSLDDAYRSGELRRLIDSLSPPEGEGDAGDEDAALRALRDLHAMHAGYAPGGGLGAGGAGGLAGAPRQGGVSLLDVPLINKVAAGYPREFTDLGYPARIADEYVRCPGLTDPDAFACRVVGDSMLPEYREGDIVVFSPAKSIKSGMDCFARIEPDHESTFKRVYFESGEGEAELIRLQPLNPAYPPRVLAREDVAGLYAAVSVTREVG